MNEHTPNPKPECTYYSGDFKRKRSLIHGEQLIPASTELHVVTDPNPDSNKAKIYLPDQKTLLARFFWSYETDEYLQGWDACRAGKLTRHSPSNHQTSRQWLRGWQAAFKQAEASLSQQHQTFPDYESVFQKYTQHLTGEEMNLIRTHCDTVIQQDYPELHAACTSSHPNHAYAREYLQLLIRIITQDVILTKLKTESPVSAILEHLKEWEREIKPPPPPALPPS